MLRPGFFTCLIVCGIVFVSTLLGVESALQPGSTLQTSSQPFGSPTNCSLTAMSDDTVDFGTFVLDKHGKPIAPRGDWVVIDAPMLPLWPAVIRYSVPDDPYSMDIDYFYRSYFKGVSRRTSGGISSQQYDSSTGDNHCFGSNPQAVAT